MLKRLARVYFLFITLLVLSVLSFIFFVHPPIRYQLKLIRQASISPVEGITYKIDDPLQVTINDVIFTVPSGFKTDLASIPRILWPILAPNDSNTIFPAILHDYLYSCGIHHTRKFSDDALYTFLLHQKVSRFTAYQYYIGVRLFGAKYYNPKDC